MDRQPDEEVILMCHLAYAVDKKLCSLIFHKLVLWAFSNGWCLNKPNNRGVTLVLDSEMRQ